MLLLTFSWKKLFHIYFWLFFKIILENTSSPSWNFSSSMINSSMGRSSHIAPTPPPPPPLPNQKIPVKTSVHLPITITVCKHWSKFVSRSSLVMSVTYLGLVLILSTKFHPDLSALSVFQNFRSPPPLMTLDLVGIQNKRSEFRGLSNYEISLRYDHSFVSQKYLIFSIFLELTLPPPTPQKRADPFRLWHIPHLGLVLIFPTKFHSNPSTLSIIQDFRFRPPSPNFPFTGSGQDLR